LLRKEVVTFCLRAEKLSNFTQHLGKQKGGAGGFTYGGERGGREFHFCVCCKPHKNLLKGGGSNRNLKEERGGGSLVRPRSHSGGKQGNQEEARSRPRRSSGEIVLLKRKDPFLEHTSGLMKGKKWRGN